MRAAAVLLAVLFLAACSESQPSAEAPAAPAAPAAAPAAPAGEPAAAPAEPAAAAAPVARPDAQGVVRVEATREGFVPNRIEAKAGQPLKLVFTRTEKKTCMSAAVFPDLGIRKDLPLNEPVEVTVTPEAGKEIRFECPMGMGKSTIVGVP